MKRQNEFDVEMRLRKLDTIRDNLDGIEYHAQENVERMIQEMKRRIDAEIEGRRAKH